MLHSVAVLLLDDMLTSSISLPLEMLYAADNTARQRQPGRQARLAVQTVAAEEHRCVRTQAGLTLLADTHWPQAKQPQLLLLPTFWRNPLRGVRKAEALTPWLRELAEAGVLLCTVSTGSFLLAEAGLLANRAATTHWSYFDTFARRYPNTLLQRHHLITQSGTVYCAGSLNAIADLMVHLISEQYSPEISRQVESQFSPEIRSQHRESLYVEGQPGLHHDETIAAVQDQLNAGSGKMPSMATIARRFDLSTRSLNRRFKDVTGLTPLQYLQQKRINDARELLHKTDLKVSDIASTVGYEDSSYFCALFKRHVQLSPQQYRSAVRGKLFGGV